MADAQLRAPGSAVLVHGMWGVPEDWRWVRGILEGRGVEVITPDLPSHRSPGAGLLDDVEEVREALRRVSRGPVVAAGWSYGCDVMAIAADGERVARLVYVSSVPLPAHPLVRDGTLFDGSPQLVWDEHGRFAPPGGWWNTEGTEFTSNVLQYFDDHPRRAVTRRTLTDPIPAAAWSHTPTTVLLGERDVFNGAEPWSRAREKIADVRVVDCDHFIPFTLPGLVADVLLEGVQSQDPN
ncbi:hypothetical protein SCMU_29510 [Sinomonas cyclohexanicum]|uniref:AB hydrolase-1 domain-containing protein n=1 Tax=Sinomonas cyclohexanicum TaxID=322009 RepID=A0ABM7PXT0_SINCY|nr:alpha/beta hydrolase [Corynebacterium cyclohexanicum]BCT77109.1 hypothetical protein SCMU_29510 [Corynebacterium cyclohexanicum]